MLRKRTSQHLRIFSSTCLHVCWGSSSSEYQQWLPQRTLLRSFQSSLWLFPLGMLSPDEPAELVCSRPQSSQRGSDLSFSKSASRSLSRVSMRSFRTNMSAHWAAGRGRIRFHISVNNIEIHVINVSRSIIKGQFSAFIVSNVTSSLPF